MRDRLERRIGMETDQYTSPQAIGQNPRTDSIGKSPFICCGPTIARSYTD